MRESEVKKMEATFSNVRILIAEDNLVNQMVALGQLHNLGYRAEAVLNGRELLKVLENNPVDLILMDCQMPEMDGFETTAEIRRREGTARHTTIIAMTANALDGDRERCLAAGMDDYLSKPVKSDALRLKLERWAKPDESRKALTEEKETADQTSDSVTDTPTRLPRREPPIDQVQLASLREIRQPGVDFVTELIDLFLNEATSHLKALHEAVMKHDAVEIQRMAHRLKGSSANMGATQMAALSEELESKDPAKDAGGLVAQLETEFVLVSEALKAERKETYQ
jgi:CheY-like chemotaxis protein/HPt (histidine-containing phosphotransfer) domain-containing protein